MSAIIAVRIPKETKKMMNQMKDLDWPEVIRKSIEEKIREEKRRRARAIEDSLRRRSSKTTNISLAKIVVREREEA